MSTANEPENRAIQLGQEITSFVRDIEALRLVHRLAMQSIIAGTKHYQRELIDFENSKCQVEERDGQRIISYSEDTRHQFFKLLRRQETGNKALVLVPRSFLVSLVSQFDAFLGAFLRVLFLLRPELLNASEKTLSFSDLQKFSTIEEVREFIIEKEVENVLRQSHSDQFDWLERKFSVKLRQDLLIWPLFIELTERRNLFVHASGRVSKQYLAICAQHKVALSDQLKSGDVLAVSRAYYEEACLCILELGIKLGHVLWRKVHEATCDLADANIVELAFDLISDEQYILAVKLLDFATETLKRHSTEDFRRTMVINRAQAYKWLGEELKAQQILDSEDWTAVSSRFVLCVAVLRNDFVHAVKEMRKIGRSGEVGKSDYRDWPIFKKLRQDENFRQAFTEIFGEELAVVTYPPEQTHFKTKDQNS